MYKYRDIRKVHLEITEKCQAGCAMCPRHDESGSGKLMHHLTNAELSLEDCKNIFEKDFIKQLHAMYMCGNFGDPIMARDTLEVFEYFRYTNLSMKLSMFTNGGARSSEWWRDLASVLYEGRVTFSVDGLEDTNHIYRENVQWDRVMNAMESFIGAGGQAEWHFLVFKHNEHQVEEARALAKKLGFKAFIPKRTSRWQNGMSVYKHLSQPEKKEYVHDVNDFRERAKQKFGGWDKFLDKTEIGCRVVKQNSMYVSAEGLVVPCCWIGGSEMYDPEVSKYKDSHLFKHIISDKSDIDAKVHGINGVFESGFFDKIEKSWSAPSLAEGKLRMCAKTCSVEHDHFEDQFLR